MDWLFYGAMEHPLHIHINPFFLVDLPLPALLKPGTAFTPWFAPGDRYDTLQVPIFLDEFTPFHVRIQPGPYAGYAFLHCHVRGRPPGGCQAGAARRRLRAAGRRRMRVAPTTAKPCMLRLPAGSKPACPPATADHCPLPCSLCPLQLLHHEDVGCIKVMKWECPIDDAGNLQPDPTHTLPQRKFCSPLLPEMQALGFKYPVPGDLPGSI